MENFEIHITGEKTIIEACKQPYIKNPLPAVIKTITVDLLKPDRSFFCTKYMTSFVLKASNLDDCFSQITLLGNRLRDSGIKIVREKIECPAFYSHYVFMSEYIESHFKGVTSRFPLSWNHNKPADDLMATDREYDVNKYDDFISKYKDQIIELCLYDTFINEDKAWFDLYKGDGQETGNQLTARRNQ